MLRGSFDIFMLFWLGVHGRDMFVVGSILVGRSMWAGT